MKKHKPEQNVALLRQIEVEMANGKTTPQACKEAEIIVQTFYRWRKEFGGLKLDQAKRLKELERENGKLHSVWWSMDAADSQTTAAKVMIVIRNFSCGLRPRDTMRSRYVTLR
jgi:hypothetical protein